MTQVLEEARQTSGVRQFDEFSAETKAQMAALPANLTDIDEAIHSASARIQLMGRADQQVNSQCFSFVPMSYFHFLSSSLLLLYFDY